MAGRPKEKLCCICIARKMYQYIVSQGGHTGHQFKLVTPLNDILTTYRSILVCIRCEERGIALLTRTCYDEWLLFITASLAVGKDFQSPFPLCLRK